MDIDRKIRDSVESFVRDIEELVRQSALDAIQASFGGIGPAAAPAAAPRRAPRVAAPVAAVAAAAPAAPRPSGAKRSPAELDQLQNDLLSAITNNPGLRIEALAQVLGVPSKTLTLPTRKLLNTKKIRKKGEKRATTYFAK